MKVGIIGDTHFPAHHPGYLSFVRDVFDQWDVEKIVHIGDVVDHHNISFHLQELKVAGVEHEVEDASACIEEWSKVFPKMEVTVGNHDRRVLRLAASAKIPAMFLRSFADFWQTPGWQWIDETVIDGVRYFHGDGCSGVRPALNAAIKTRVSTVIGHVHAVAGIMHSAGPFSRIFGMDVGCGVDRMNPAMAYGKYYTAKPFLSCGVVIDGHPYHEVMNCGPNEPYHRSNF